MYVHLYFLVILNSQHTTTKFVRSFTVLNFQIMLSNSKLLKGFFATTGGSGVVLVAQEKSFLPLEFNNPTEGPILRLFSMAISGLCFDSASVNFISLAPANHKSQITCCLL